MAREPYRETPFLRKLQCALELLPITLQRDPSYGVRPGGWGPRRAEFFVCLASPYESSCYRVVFPRRCYPDSCFVTSYPNTRDSEVREVVRRRAGDQSMANFLMEVGEDCARRRAELDRRACLASCPPELLPRHLVVHHILPFI